MHYGGVVGAGNIPRVHAMESRTVHFHNTAKVVLDMVLLKSNKAS
jgi:hypothetical protein